MTTLSNCNGKHLTLSDRIAIETGIENGDSFTKIAKRLGKSPSSISREVRRHLFLVPHYYNENSRRKSECIHFNGCQIKGVCGNTACPSICSKCRSKRCAGFCSAFETQKCSQLLKPPYVCNKCPHLRRCSHDFYFYRAKYADDTYQELKTSSRNGINQSPESLEQLDRLVSPLVKQGQSISHIYLTHKTEIPCSQRTLYSYIDQNLFSVINLDLPRKVKYKRRKLRKKDIPVPNYRLERTYADFQTYMSLFPETAVVEMDVVEGSGGKDDQVFLTLFFRNCSLMLIILLPADRREYIRQVFDTLLEELGAELYSKLFPVILTDNGGSFQDPAVFERPDHEEVTAKVFYCDPMASWQKGRLEKNHEFIRYVLPKGTSFSDLTQEKTTLLTNHINSTARASLNGCTPFQLALLLLDPKLMKLHHLEQIPADQICLKPSLLKDC